MPSPVLVGEDGEHLAELIVGVGILRQDAQGRELGQLRCALPGRGNDVDGGAEAAVP